MSASKHLTAVDTPSLAVQINTATKKLHTELNRLIIERLPLALPPHTNTPARYTVGITQFASVFYEFERLFDQLEESDDDEHKDNIKRWLMSLRPHGLERTVRLQRDLAHLQKVTQEEIESTAALKLRQLVQQKPHILAAYAWIMYMAIFSGGRWIRQQLASAGEDFWSTSVDDKRPLEVPGFTFLSFDGADDGEDLKIAFKKRLSYADDLLTQTELDEIIEAGQDLFQHCIDLVEKIDRDVWWHESTSGWPFSFLVLGLGFVWLFWRLCTGQSILTD